MDACTYHHPIRLPPSNSSFTPIQTGDEASMSPDGYISITGRVKDLIIRGGENIHPLEIENCLLSYPGVVNVSVVGVPDERYGEVVAAFIIHREPEGALATEEKIRQWVGQKLSNHLGMSLSS